MKRLFYAIAVIFAGMLCLIGCGGQYERPADTVASRIQAIRSTKNTDISGRTGKVYYVSADGDDSGDGLSPETAWKSLKKLNEQAANKKIKPTDSVLLRRGDVFRGAVNIQSDDILYGSYGDEKLAKPQILVSPHDGTTVGEWTLAAPNIWKYTVDGERPFAEDIGLIWCFEPGGDIRYTQKITTPESFDESDLDIATLLTDDLQFYHTGHPYAFNNRAQELYLYSASNPKDRFSRIEFAPAKSGIAMWNKTNIIINNLDVRFAGIHGVSSGTVANLHVTDCEFSYIGGAIQKYENGKVTRYGNGIEIYGSVTQKNGYAVEDGYVVKNNYVHDIYDAGITFQLSTDDPSPVERVIFDGNVIERCVYSIEYWNNCWSKDEALQQQTYINIFEITNNIMRYAGYGVCSTRPDKNQSAHIKTWKHNVDNRVTGSYIIKSNIFDTAAEHVFYVYAADARSLPTLKNNTIKNAADVPFGYMYFDKKVIIPYDTEALAAAYPNNSFEITESAV